MQIDGILDIAVDLVRRRKRGNLLKLQSTRWRHFAMTTLRGVQWTESVLTFRYDRLCDFGRTLVRRVAAAHGEMSEVDAFQTDGDAINENK